jgi:glycosyltransferase involved in cell wall biosynthesis
MESPLVSCIVPVFNGEKYIAETLDSILAQTHRPLEVIVIDDGSTDGTAAIVMSYGDRVRYSYQKNAGPAAAYNSALGLVQGSYVAFLGADDLWHREKTARQLARFTARPELDYCVTHLQNFWIPELQEEADRLKDHRLARPMPGYTSATLLARRRLFDEIGAFDATLQHGHDLDWFLRAAEHGAKMELLPDVLMYRRMHHTNRSRELADNSRSTYLRILKASLDRRRREGRSSPSRYEFPESDWRERGGSGRGRVGQPPSPPTSDD